MSWQAKQGPATFRGVPFFVDAVENTGGRQVVHHEFPFSEGLPFTEDLGKKGRAFQVEGYVVGPDYEAARDALQAALEQPGPGELVHPYLGSHTVAIVSYRVRQTRVDGGLATFSFECKETAALPSMPSSKLNAPAALAEAASVARSASVAEFVASHSDEPFAGFGGEVSMAASEVQAAMGAVKSLQGMLNIAAVSGVLRAKFEQILASSPAGDFVKLSEYIADFMGGLVNTVADALETVAKPFDVAGELLKLFGFNPGPRPSTLTPGGVVEAANFDAHTRLIQRYALTGAALALATAEFETYDDAIAARDALTSAIDEHLYTWADDTYLVFAEMRSAVVAAVPGEASDLPRLQVLEQQAALPSLVLAHKLYGNLDREAELIRRNGVRHPGFVSGTLEVLSRG